jgi:hypothetical protein
VTSPSFQPEDVQEIIAGLAVEWYFDRRIVAYRLTKVSQRIIETWTETALDILRDWRVDTPYLALHDVSNPGVSLQYCVLVNFDLLNIGVTSDGTARAGAIIAGKQGFTARVAIGFNMSLSGQVSYKVMGGGRKLPNVEYKTFFNRETSLAWLAQDSQATDGK